MGRLLILLVAAHLVMDLAVPTAGAFRSSSDESVVALRVEPLTGQDVAPVLTAEPLRLSVERCKLAPEDPPEQLGGNVGFPDFPLLLPRRDPAHDRSPHGPAEDA